MLPLQALDPARFDTPAILKRLSSSSRALQVGYRAGAR